MIQKNVDMTQQCQNKNLTKDDTIKVQVSACLHLCYTMFTLIFTPTLTQSMIQTKRRKMWYDTTVLEYKSHKGLYKQSALSACLHLCLHHASTYAFTFLHLCLNLYLNHVNTYVYTMFIPMFTRCLNRVPTYLYTMFTPMFASILTPC